MTKFLKFVEDSWKEGTQIDKYNISTAIFIGAPSHIFLYFLYTFLIPLPYESLFLRLIVATMCISTYFYKYLPKTPFISFFVSIHWHLMVMLSLNLSITYLLLKNNFNEIYLYWEIFAVFSSAIYIPNWLAFLVDLTLSIALAILLFVITTPVFDLSLKFNVLGYSLTLGFTAFTAVIFVYANRSVWLAKQESHHKKISSLAGSIVHEIRNPLGSISLVGSSLKDLSKSFMDSDKDKLSSIVSSILESVKQANEIIDIALYDLQNKPIIPKDFSSLNPNKILSEILTKYGYKNAEEKAKTRLNITDDNNFFFRAVPERFSFVIYNLLKNALYYLKQYPDSTVTVGTETRTIEGKSWNVIYVYDTGPGIPPDIIPKLFDDFFTSGKKEGTGLGLAFCKRNMLAFGGDIICESEFGGGEGKNGWTKFSLLFPPLSEEEIKSAEIESKKKKVLVVDDQRANLLAVKSKIEKGLIYISCDTALGGREGLRVASENKYDLILMDIQMPELNGIEVTKKIRTSDTQTPIIAITSLDYETFTNEIEAGKAQGDFSYYISKSVPENILYRTITKWLIDVDDNLSYLGVKESYMPLLHDKNAILADDQDLNRMVTKNKLKSSGMKITEVKDGKELVEVYKNSLDANGKSTFDIILTDINMPPYNGDEAAMQIREIELRNKIPHQNRMPIIALSGDGDQEAIYHFFKSQMTDYFVKGRDPESLIKIIANCFAEKDEEINEAPQNLVESEPKIVVEKKIETQIAEETQTINHEKIDSFSESDHKEILNLFLKDGEEIMNKIRQYQKDNNIGELSFATHSIKGITSNIGGDKLYEYIKEIEPNLKSGKLPEDQNWMQKMEVLYADLDKEIRAILK
ncbi:MAG: response regulator [Proteobacteria bacterium]|nr:response regulator [Pseudomonadota bacterium]